MDIEKSDNWIDLKLTYADFTMRELIRLENINQLDKWGEQNHTIFEWLTYITEEVGELSKAISEYVYRGGRVDQITKEGIQVITLTLKVVEMALKRGEEEK